MWEITPEIIAFLGLFIGVITGVGVPYLRKIYLGEISEFQIYYIWQGLAAVALALIVTLLAIPTLQIPDGISLLKVLGLNFILGFGSNSLVHEIFALHELKDGAPEPEPAPAPTPEPAPVPVTPEPPVITVTYGQWQQVEDLTGKPIWARRVLYNGVHHHYEWVTVNPNL